MRARRARRPEKQRLAVQEAGEQPRTAVQSRPATFHAVRSSPSVRRGAPWPGDARGTPGHGRAVASAPRRPFPQVAHGRRLVHDFGGGVRDGKFSYGDRSKSIGSVRRRRIGRARDIRPPQGAPRAAGGCWKPSWRRSTQGREVLRSVRRVERRCFHAHEQLARPGRRRPRQRVDADLAQENCAVMAVVEGAHRVGRGGQRFGANAENCEHDRHWQRILHWQGVEKKAERQNGAAGGGGGAAHRGAAHAPPHAVCERRSRATL